MRSHPIIAELLTPAHIRIGVSVGAVVLCAALIGATAAPAAAQISATAQHLAHGLLQIRFVTPDPLVMPPAPTAGEQLAVLADPPADLSMDADLLSNRDVAMIRQADAVQAHDAQVQAALWAQEEARMQAQIDAAMRPSPSIASPTNAAQAQISGDQEVTASAGDTRKAAPAADSRRL